MKKAFCISLLFSSSAVFAGSIGDVQLKGYLGERLEAMIERHVVGTDVDYITAPFLEKTERRYWWQSEFWGKYMHSAVPYSMYLEGGKGTREELKGKIERGVDRMLSSQEPCGYIGNYPEELRCGEGWDVWGIKYTMMGLLHYYDGERGSEKGKRALESCRRLCDYVIAEIGPNGKRGRELWQTGNWSGYASSSILEPVMWLYKRTKDRKYLDFAAYVVKGMTEPKDGPRLLDMALKGVSVADRNDPGYNMNGEWSYVCKKGRSKAYEMMSCYQGFLEYFEVTGRKDLFEAAVKTGEDIIKEEVNLAGGCASSEAWFHGARKQHLPYERLQETCVTTTWMRFCEKLLDMTGDSRWADQIERTFYNSYLAAMKADGSEFAGYTPLSGNRWHGQHHCFMHTDCCTANGPRGFLCFLKKLFRVKDGAAEFNFYASALAKGELSDGRKVAFDMYSLYPRSEKARIVSHTENVGMVPLKLRIPAWSTNTVVKLNGKELPGAKGGTYFTLEHEWKLGDVVEIEFAMPVVAHKVSHHVAFTRGPVLLARDSRFGDGDMTEPFRWRDIEDGKFTENFNAVRTPSGEMWMAFSATLPVGTHHENPEAALPTTVNFCDYASAGNRWERDNYYRTWFPVEFGPAD
jgi:DUF1680 family protein